MSPHTELDNKVQEKDTSVNSYFKRVEDIEAEIEAPDEGDSSFSWATLWAYTGPGWLMSIAYLDPGNLESDLQAGAYAGYQLIWVLFASTVMGLVLQILAARLGVVTGKNLAEVCRERYPAPVSFTLWVMTEIAIIGSDIQEVVGSAIAFKILFGWPLWFGSLVTGLDTFTFLGLHYYGVRKLEALFAVLIGTMCVCFFIDFGYMSPPIGDVVGGFEPIVANYAIVQAVGIVGAVIMPHNIYLHSALVKSRKVDRTNTAKVTEANKYFAIEAAGALGISFFINLAVLAVFAAGFYSQECAEEGLGFIDGKCSKIGLNRAGEALEGPLGSTASYVWAVGLLAAGQASTMTGTFAGQYVMEGFLDLKIAPWLRVLFTRGIALVPAILVAILSDSNSSAGDDLGEWLNVLQNVQLPFALLPVLHFTNSRELMGDFKNGKIVRTVVWAVAILVLVVNVVLVLDFVLDEDNPTPHTWWFYTICFAIGVAYFGFIAYLMKNEFLSVYHWFQKHYRQRYQPFNDDKSDYSEEMYEGDDRFGRKSNSPYARFDASEHTEG